VNKRRLRRILALGLVAVGALGLARRFWPGSEAFVSKPSAECIRCHEEENIQRSQIAEWRHSAHARKGVGCFECHKAAQGEPDAWEHEGTLISTIVSPFDCGACHTKEFTEFDRSHHAKAGEILGSLDNFLGEVVEGPGASVQGCQYCHGSLVKVIAPGKLDPATWPNAGVGRLNPDGSKGSCSTCHSKHSFSLKVARSPEACGRCHMGPDHPQKEIYEESKHGVIYAAHKGEMDLGASSFILGEDYTQAPNCVTCHMGSSLYSHGTHDLGERISWQLRTPVSKPMENAETKREEMQRVCRNCHGPEWYGNFYTQYDATVNLYNDSFGKPATEIMNVLNTSGALTKDPFDEEIEWVYFELWHHEVRRARHGAAMMGPDYVQWHGFYEIAQHFYFKFIPLARSLGAGQAVDSLLAQPEHAWISGIAPQGVRLQEAAFEQWGKVRKDALTKRTAQDRE